MTGIKRRSVVKDFLNSMRTKFWFENLKKLTHSKSINELVDYITAQSSTFSYYKCESVNTWNKYSSGREIPRFETIKSIERLVPHSASAFFLGPNSIPLWVSLSDEVNISDARIAWLLSFDWPESVKKELQVEKIHPLYHLLSNTSESVFINSLESYEDRFKPTSYQEYLTGFTDYALIDKSLEFSLNLPPVNFWHELTRLILMYRKLHQSEVQELHFQMQSLSWSEVLEDDSFFDEQLILDYEDDEDKFEHYDELSPVNWQYFLEPNEKITRKDIKNEFINLLNDNEEIINSYGLLIRDFDFLMLNLHEYLTFTVKFNKRKNIPRWQKPL